MSKTPHLVIHGQEKLAGRQPFQRIGVSIGKLRLGSYLRKPAAVSGFARL